MVDAIFDVDGRNYTSQRATLAGLIRRTFNDQDVVAELDAVAETNEAVLFNRFLDEMEGLSESVNQSTTSIGPVSADGGNSGNATILTTDLLDGVTSPGTMSNVQYPTMLNYREKSSELFVAEVHRVECSTDAFGNASDATYTWTGDRS